ncbi:fatty acid-binding protein 12 [Pteropus medius]|uniref:fatty acid-binding protein 12 n=1 Tax=Pteropus vampyrus TaxID=132908 RepID=UPI00196AF555|nr:fatty acid-binding protein 12 [Pteropus giganteus]
MVDQFQGTWKSISCENFEDYMKELGIGRASRKLGCLAKPTVTINTEGDVTTIKTKSIFKNNEISFKLGEEFEETTPGGHKTKSVITLDNDSLIQIEDWDGKKISVKRTVVDGKMVVESVVNSVICTRTYERVEANSASNP